MKVLNLVIFISLIAAVKRNVLAHSVQTSAWDSETSLENIIVHTPSRRVDAHSHFELSFSLPGQGALKLSLEPNHDILAQESRVQYLGTDGVVRRTEAVNKAQHKVFKGLVSSQHTGAGATWNHVGWARIYIHQDGDNPLFEGIFSVVGQQYQVTIISGSGNTREPPMVVHYHSAYHTWDHLVARSPQSSGNPFITDEDLPCPSTRRVALVGIATDCTYSASFTSSNELRRNIINMVNTASEVYERTFNISLALHDLTISDRDCPSTPSSSTSWNADCSAGDLNWRLSRFTSWRGSLNDGNAYWTLMTGCSSGQNVGVSWIGQLCTSNRGQQRASGANVVARTGSEWQVFAHESGHTFGAVHDCDSTLCASSSQGQCCPLSSSTCDANGQYIMNPASSSSQSAFSPCSIRNICSQLRSGGVSTSCLVSNSNITTITDGQCGNGIVEVGEECDCGANCAENSCCDGSTCRLRVEAVCDDAVSPCCTNCQFASADTVCRPSTGPCDVEETCTGNSTICPADQFLSDGQRCRDDGAGSPISRCSNGECREEDRSWVERHRSLVIGLAAGVGGALVLAILGCMICSCCQRPSKKASPGVPVVSQVHPPPPPPYRYA
ncbi:disintegrin and metalloproteinase domain-containing protein B [Aspergillus udagawae]|uniref:Disintegrin and metalloproteinase domain-containing protein B n=1 Tax=Aspergillus udagawae TaxID=91492 RepID=A0A8H3N3G0_9EURO|nr:disintegrin and metalloproteinase domain-containing protein B [Aspergillus udagawae]